MLPHESDYRTPLTYTYDRLGRQVTVLRNGMTTSLSYNSAGQRLTEAYTGGMLAGLSMNWTYDNALRPETVTARNGAANLEAVAYDYDLAGRLWTVASGSESATYAYQAHSSLLDTVRFRSNLTERLVTTRKYDRLNRLENISSKATAALPVSFGYQYNGANQRTRATLEDGSYWIYHYDELGQVTSGRKYWSDGAAVVGQQFEYAFDDIGNRKTTGGRASAPSTYTVNRDNQYTNRTVAGVVDVVGVANPTANVTVGIQGQTATVASRKGEYFHHPLTVSNSTAQYPTVEIKSLYGATQTETGEVFVSPASETYAHDADGNLTRDGRWTYTWDGENRLVELVSLTNAPVQSKRWLKFEYDYQGRRILKTVWQWTNSTWLVVVSNKFLYHDWNPVGELNATNNAVIRSYVWGNDVSGSPQGAGGVGGLLWMKPAGGVAQFVAGDGNGNVAALVSGSDGSSTARYEYGPFGEPARVSGTLGTANPFRFSTKYQDDETDLLYYDYRYYNPSTGRWPSRDPIDEKSELNLYGFVRQDAVSKVDVDGREIGQVCSTCGQYYVGTHVCLGPPVPLGTNEVGFEMCRRNVFETDWKDRAGNDCCGGLHMFVRQKYVDDDGNPIYRGWGFDRTGPHQEGDALGKFLPTCASCKKSPRKLMYGDGKDTPGDKATDEQIWDCLTKVPRSREYDTLFYNCQSYAWQAASKCGLDCRNPGPPPGRK